MQGFKSFAKRTEIIFSMGVNCILGANGSGKSNIADAICFVLGRRSIKSMRAARARNLIFMGSKYIKPSREAFVEIIFDNTDRGFNIDKDEVHIRRTVRVNGQSIYKLNGEIKTSAEILETLAQAGIDPYGFNLILQGQIQSIVRMHSEDRRKIIEEVSGIAVYESRKKKALHELEKTDEKLKEIGAILRERGIFLRNLEKEKEQAEKYNELQSTVKRAKATILHKRSEEKKREIHSILKSIQDKNEQKEKIINRRKKVEKDNQVLDEKINGINKEIQRATGVEQGELQEQIVNLKSEIEGLKVRKENYENKKTEIERRIEQVSNSIPELEQEIEELKKESPITAKKAAELKEKKNELTIIEEERKKLIAIESELNSIKERKNEKERQIAKTNAESESLLRQIEEELSKLNHKTEDECIRAIQSQKEKLIEKNKEITGIEKAQIENEKIVSVSDFEIKRLGDIKNKLDNIDVCPLCQTKITGDHVKHVFNEADEGIEIARKKKEKANEEITRTMEIKHKLANEIKSNEESITRLEFELNKHKNAKEKQERLKKIVEEEKVLKNELKRFEEKRINLEKAGEGIDRIEEQYHKKMLEIEEISSRNDENIDNLLLYKQRDLESFNTIIKQSKKGLKEVEEDIEEITSALDKKIDVLDENENRAVEEQANYLKIGKAKADAELDATNMELSEFAGVELLQGSIQHLEERLRKAQESLLVIGNINMRALQVYQEVKKEYDIVQDKAGTIEKEKIEILKIIEEVDKKKTREFMKTFKGINALFSENFAKLSAKGHAYLEIENQEDIFAGGINIIVKLAKGKYFDVTSLSGGEQT